MTNLSEVFLISKSAYRIRGCEKVSKVQVNNNFVSDLNYFDDVNNKNMENSLKFIELGIYKITT